MQPDPGDARGGSARRDPGDARVSVHAGDPQHSAPQRTDGRSFDGSRLWRLSAPKRWPTAIGIQDGSRRPRDGRQLSASKTAEI